MSDYTNDFYEYYLGYLKEASVRKSHDKMFRKAMQNPDFNNVVDFGCGLSEFATYAKPEKYLGIDSMEDIKHYNKNNIIIADYRTCEDLKELLKDFKPTSFISLFSIEITAPIGVNVEEYDYVREKYALYEKIFEQIPSIKSGLVSGFYYTSKMDHNPVVEEGGVTSFQTLPGEHYVSKIFSEEKKTIETPSSFGKDVREIWKFLKRI